MAIAASLAMTSTATLHAANGPHAAGSWGAQKDGTFHNPVLPADYSDIDCIRVGNEYFTISSTFQYSPGMVILRSKDLINWRIVGHAITDITQISPDLNWDKMNRYGRGVWAGSIRHHAGRFWIYFGTADEGYFMTSAPRAEGPWEPLTCVMKDSGWDDCCPFWDDDGQGYLVGTRFAPDPKTGAKYNIHLFKLSTDGKSLMPGFDEILYQSQGSEASKLYKWNGLYYHFFSEVKPEGRVTMMRRSATLTGPAEVRQLNHVKLRPAAGEIGDHEPNQGGIVQAPDGRWWFVTHQGTGSWEGRTMCVLPVTWRDGWPIIGEVGADGIGNMVWQDKMPVLGQPRSVPQSSDFFRSSQLGPQWEWNYQPRKEKWSLTQRRGWLRLHAFAPLERGNLFKAGNTLTQRVFGCDGVATVKLDISKMADGQAAGLCQYGGRYAWLGAVQENGACWLTYNFNGAITRGPVITSKLLWLQTRINANGTAKWAYSFDGRNFTAFGETYRLEWANYRGSRLGIFTYNDSGEAGFVDVDSFQYDFAGPHR